MILQGFTESVAKQTALAWLESAGWQFRNDAKVVPGEPAAGSDDCGQVFLARRLRDTLLPSLISGELRVKDAERIIAGASA